MTKYFGKSSEHDPADFETFSFGVYNLTKPPNLV
jgi:hypothetical protein